MFWFGSKKEQKDMLGRTIAELKELRAELSDLRDSLRQIVPENREKAEEISTLSGGPGEDAGAMTTAAQDPGEIPGLTGENADAVGECTCICEGDTEQKIAVGSGVQRQCSVC